MRESSSSSNYGIKQLCHGNIGVMEYHRQIPGEALGIGRLYSITPRWPWHNNYIYIYIYIYKYHMIASVVFLWFNSDHMAE